MMLFIIYLSEYLIYTFFQAIYKSIKIICISNNYVSYFFNYFFDIYFAVFFASGCLASIIFNSASTLGFSAAIFFFSKGSVL